MTSPSATPTSALARMVRPRKPIRAASHGVMEDLADGMFRGPAKTGHGIDLVIRNAVAERVTQARALDGLPQAAVPHIMDHDDGQTSLLVFDGALVDALIEQQTLGRVSSAPRVDRPVTSIDAALSTGFAASVVAQLATLCETRGDATALAGYSCGRPQIDRATLSLALGAKSYDVLRITLDIGPGLKVGQAQLIVPAANDAVAKPIRAAQINPRMVAILSDALVHLQVQLPPVSISVKTLVGLETGSAIRLPKDALGAARLKDQSGRVLVGGRLGQFNGCRAIRVVHAPQNDPRLATTGPEALPTALTTQDIGSLAAAPQALLAPGDTEARALSVASGA